MILQGIDISHHNKSLIRSYGRQWLREKASEGFVIMKATEGQTWMDPMYPSYVDMIGPEHILARKNQVGFYHYARPENNTPQEEVDNFLGAVSDYIGTGLLALDVEGRALECPNVGEWVYEWLKLVKRKTGVKPVVYCQRSALPKFELAASGDYGLWLASWTKSKPSKISPWSFMALWQYKGVGLDEDYFFGSPEQWRKYARSI